MRNFVDSDFIEYTIRYQRLVHKGYDETIVRRTVGLLMGEDPRVPDDIHAIYGIPVLRGEFEEAIRHDICG